MKISWDMDPKAVLSSHAMGIPKRHINPQNEGLMTISQYLDSLPTIGPLCVCVNDWMIISRMDGT